MGGGRKDGRGVLGRAPAAAPVLYTFGALVESNSYYMLRTPYGIAMARDDLAVLEQLGCSPEEKNIFGISPAMMMRFNPTPEVIGLRHRVVEVR